jgi:Ni/Co efflux regulator RcnB
MLMTSKSIVCAVAALSMGLSGFAVAQQDRDRAGDRGGHEEHAAPRAAEQSHGRAAPQGPVRGPGAGPNHNFYSGGRLPQQYRGGQYVVSDWRGHHLRQPPRGYQWVQTGPDFVLVAITTGIIASILLNQ